MQNPTSKIFLWFVALVWLLVLSKYILFKKSPSYYKEYFLHHYSRQVIKEDWKKANLKPFTTIALFSSSSRLSTEYKLENLGGNIIGFIPLGFLIPLLIRRKRNMAFKTVGAVFLISLGFEVTQLLTGLGSFDVDDLILNTLGGSIGFLLNFIFRKVNSPGSHLSYS